jgi:membrane associated rhomboid family serine protease
MEPSIIILIATVAVSLWAFQDAAVLQKLLFSPYFVVHRRQWYRIISHAFIHADTTHLLFNMIALWSFGSAVFRYFSYMSNIPEVHFYVMYFTAIVFSSISDLIKHRDHSGYASLGASGAVSAVIFTCVLFDPWSMIYVFFIPCPGILFAVLYLWYSSYMSKRGRDGIAHDAHFYGSVFGLIYPLLINPAIFKLFIYQLTHPSFI